MWVVLLISLLLTPLDDVVPSRARQIWKLYKHCFLQTQSEDTLCEEVLSSVSEPQFCKTRPPERRSSEVLTSLFLSGEVEAK